MIEDTQCKIRKNNYEISDKFMLCGFSASGDSVTLMAIIHPERIQCVVAGGLGGFPILPITSLEGDSLNYPVGISDFEKLFNKKFNVNAFKLIPMKFFQGDIDENDSVSEGDELIHDNNPGGYQILRLMQSDCENCRINKVAFFCKTNKKNIIRIRIYNADNENFPNQLLIPKSLIIDTDEKKNWVEIFLVNYNIIVPKSFFVGIEFLNEKVRNPMILTHLFWTH